MAAASFTPAELANYIRRRMPDFQIGCLIDPLRQGIVDSWPDSPDDTAAREEWGWRPAYDLDTMVDDTLEDLDRKLARGARDSTGQLGRARGCGLRCAVPGV